MRDSQRQAVYNWEDDILEGMRRYECALDLASCQELVNELWRDYTIDFTPPKVTCGRGQRRALARGWWEISLPKWSRNKPIIIHEVAHCLLDRSLRGHRPHGKRFARFVLEMYTRYFGIDKFTAKSIGVHQKPRRVRFASPGDVPKPIRRKSGAWAAV